jgi:3-hydroxyisobutyrate dehydrogenase-like beta-hydroxyacid dehydrogenase
MAGKMACGRSMIEGGGIEMSSGNKGAVGVIGLGIMGSAIAANLVKSGFEVIGTDILPEARSALKEAGGEPVASSGEVGKACRRIIVSIASEAALYQVCDQLAASCANGTIVMETGTLPLAAKQKVRSLLAAKGVILLDCTLSGTGVHAKAKDLTVYASGDTGAIKQLAPILDGFARVCYDLGDFGNGTKMKFVANLLVAVHIVAAAEAILLGVRSGLNPETVVKAIGDGAGSSSMFQVRGPLMANRAWDEPNVKNSVFQKDMKLIGEALQEAGCPAPLFSACMPIYIAANASGHSEHDTAAVYEILERISAEASGGKEN